MGDAAGGQGPTAEVESMELVVKKLLSTPTPLSLGHPRSPGVVFVRPCPVPPVCSLTVSPSPFA